MSLSERGSLFFDFVIISLIFPHKNFSQKRFWYSSLESVPQNLESFVSFIVVNMAVKPDNAAHDIFSFLSTSSVSRSVLSDFSTIFVIRSDM